MTVFSVTGKVVGSYRTSEIDTSMLPKGLYLIKIEYQGRMTTRKVVRE
jgi:hypothetical protein